MFARYALLIARHFGAPPRVRVIYAAVGRGSLALGPEILKDFGVMVVSPLTACCLQPARPVDEIADAPLPALARCALWPHPGAAEPPCFRLYWVRRIRDPLADITGGQTDVPSACGSRKEHTMKTRRVATALAIGMLACTPGSVLAQDKGKTEAAKLASESQAALQKLTASVPLAAELTKKATAILVFPSITKAGLGIGGQYGEGALLKKGTAVAYYKTTGASFGLQAGGQKYGYAMFFMSAKALGQLDNANGFEVGVGPSVVVVDEGMGKSMTTTTLKDDVYAFIFGQKGLMAGLGVQGNKIQKITPK